ncbi:HET-domain-containing protein [Lentithecium fluviatile CBS 122367]|uniref:HET-domain-containing protein n=1 Tax=Lentithecium fluviatile CBS 122367 TaxID=1168545 RepID=A0A6G1JGW2_9PLEO|nr:HET-domain-containing protein [Lentithecium fluviatile CBS 122367]
MSEPSIYARRILSGREFRLLLICPSSDPHQRLECYCRPFQLDAAPPYEALSYVWGAPNPTSELLCNGKSIAVGLELGNALTRLRLPDSTRMIWADALCINQDDNEEKSHQVPLMGSIYSQARRVVVWLGHGDVQQTMEAAQCVEKIAEACRQYDRERDPNPTSFQRYKALVLPVDIFTTTVCSSLRALYDRPWFSRVWCIQEIRLARDALVLWGQQEFSWSNIGLAASWIFDKTVTPDKSEAVTTLLAEVAVEHADIMYDAAIAKAPLLDVLLSYRDFESTNPKDKVYGVLNLVAPYVEVEALKLDYKKSVGEVYADTVLSTIRLYSRLTAFAYVTHPEEYSGSDEVRSWAPRWDEPWVPMPMGIPEASCPWSACAGYRVRIVDAHHIGPKRLRLFGILYEKVAAVRVIMDYENLQDPAEIDGVHPFLSVSENIMKSSGLNLHKDSMEQWYMFARTLTAGSSGDADYVQNLDEKARETFYCAFAHFMKRLSTLASRGTEGPIDHDPASIKFQDDAYNMCKQRRLFWTQNGSYGLGPKCMQTGDVVAVLFGGNTPYVLRPHSGEYLFLGQAYVDGIMQGQLVHELQAGRVQGQEFCLI